MPKKREYNTVRDGDGVVYDTVKLLRANGAQVTLDAKRNIRIRMGHMGRWKTRTLTKWDLLKEYGPGTIAHSILLSHAACGTVDVLAR